MSTFSFLQNRISPVVVNRANMPVSGDKIFIMRPSEFSNPFKIDSRLSTQDIISAFQHIAGEPLPEGSIGNYFPKTLSLIRRGGSINRSECLECFREYWYCLRELGVVKDSDILSLAGKQLVCCCHPKKCHGDVLVEDFRATIKRSPLGC